MSEQPGHTQDPDDRAEAMEEHHRKAKEHNPDERAPAERQGGHDPVEEGLGAGLPASAANRPTG
jgi:hypothetical protein